jgi:eukaryotic-like serine/threonine-protein kinase
VSSHPPSSGTPSTGSPSSGRELEKALQAIRGLAGRQYEVLGPLGRDRRNLFAFLAREPGRDRLVVLMQGGPGADRYAPATLEVFDQLDASIPPPVGSYPVCHTPFAGWGAKCPECGVDLAGGAGEATSGKSEQELLDLVRSVAPGYEVLGFMRRAEGGGPVYFARDLVRGELVALRLEQENAPGRRPTYTASATRMMLEPPTSVPSPPVAVRAIRGPATTPSGAEAPDGPEERICPQCGGRFDAEVRFCPRDGAALRTRARPADLIGLVIAERYHILGKLGEGGMGLVYLAEHVRMGRRCAVKVMHSALMHDADAVARFNREAANASRINHPNVAAIYDFGETPDNIVYLAMELVEGESLASIVARDGALLESRAVELGRQVAEAVNAAHELGIVHRDLKPDNIMVMRARDGRDIVKVVDFGIAKATQGERLDVTRTGFVIGTPDYMSPEQVLGDPLDPRSDIYSLGSILFEMLTGKRPFTGPSGEVSVRLRLTEAPPHPRQQRDGLSPELDEIVTKAMARLPEERFQNALQLRDALQEVQRSQAPPVVTGPRSVTPATPFPPPAVAQTAVTAPLPSGGSEVEQPVPGDQSPPQVRRRGRGVLVLLVLLLLGGAGYWHATRPHLQFTNHLAAPVRLTTGGDSARAVAAGERVTFPVARGRSLVAEWELVRPLREDGQPLGEAMKGRTVVRRPRGTVIWRAGAREGESAYFAPLITNAATEPLRIMVNAELRGAVDCGCVIAPGAIRLFIGYYRLFQNSTVRASGKTTAGQATFRDLGPQVTRVGGTVGLRFEDRDLRHH